MIRSLTCVCALLAGASGLYLYTEKHRTTLLDQQISRIVASTQQVRERTSMLRAEWALLNQPDRLQLLSTRFLPQLGAMAPTQFVQMASLDPRLPAVGPETPPHPIATPQTAPSLVGAKTGSPPAAPQPDADTAAIASAEAPRQGTPAQAVALADASAATQPAQAAAPHETARLTRSRPAAGADTQLADADATDTPHQDVVPQATLRRVAAHGAARPAAHVAHLPAPVRLASNGGMTSRPAVVAVSSGYARPPVIAAAAWHPAQASWPVARPVSYTPSASAPMVGSALGSSRSSLPAPVPVSDGN